MEKKKTKTTSDGLDILQKEFYEGKPDRIASLDEERSNVKIALTIQTLRDKAGLTQAELARLVGTSRTVITRLESADYDGHTVSMLRRIAAAVNNRIEFKFVPIRKVRPIRGGTVATRSTRRTAARKKATAVAKKRSKTTA